MASSKIFLGCMPELLNEIIQYLQDDHGTLHSCILINRLWCRLAIPFLWKNPFSIKCPKNYCYIDVYLHDLSDDDKTKLNEYGIKISVFSSNTLFNYPGFFKCLKIHDFGLSIKEWIDAKIYKYSIRTFHQHYLGLIYTFLIERFVKNEANLHTFEFKGYYEDIIILEIILQNPKFIYNIRNLFINFLSNNKITALLKLLLSNHNNSISKIYFQFRNIDNNINELTKNYSSQVINSQHNLKKLIIDDNSTNVTHLNHLLLSLKNSNCLNTLETIIFYKINFKNIKFLKEVFEQLNVLESIHIFYCHFIHEFIQQIIHITKPFKLKSLYMDNEIIACGYDITLIINSMQLLFQKSGKYLENIKLFDFMYDVSKELKEKSLELIKNYCRNVKRFSSSIFNIKNAYLVLNIIENFKQNLNYLTIHDHRKYKFSIILLNLGQILPYKLEYLHLEFEAYDSYISDLEVFLKNFKNIFIEKLILQIIGIQNVAAVVLPYIKKYIMKEKRVKYLATHAPKQVLANEGKEFKLYNIEYTSIWKIINDYTSDLL